MLTIYNSLTKQKAPFTPLDEKNIRMYVCGMTVYDYCHLGHARVLVVFDVVTRLLRHIYGNEHVTYVRNITDIDDKIIKRAQENDEQFDQLTNRFIDEMNRDADALGVTRPDVEPRATMFMDQIIDMINTLISKGYAYAADNGDVYYDVSEFETYGQLAGRNLEDDRAGARVEVDEAKRDAMDFVLWKAAKPGEPAWQSPWGEGRPGWHIECSAMSTHCLGNHFDIHGGGLDLKFPHHENEIAQSEAATGETFANVWMHNGHIMVDEEKMSKSLGNFFTVREVLKLYTPEVIRYFILSSHYRSPLNYTQDNLDQAGAALERFYLAMCDLDLGQAAQETEYEKRFFAAMQDDFNTPESFAVLFDLAREVNRLKAESDNNTAAMLAGLMVKLGAYLGIMQQNPEDYLRGEASDDDARIDDLVTQRNQARQDKNWAEADRIRDVLQVEGVIIEDSAGVTSWRRV